MVLLRCRTLPLHIQRNLLKARRTKCIKHILFTHNLISWSLSAKQGSALANSHVVSNRKYGLL